MNIKTLGIAICAGLATVFAAYSALYAGTAAIPLLALAVLPIYISALAWGTYVGAAASVVAIIAAATMISPQAAVVIGLGFTLPASIIGHQANLAQPDETGTLEWYPLSQLLLNLALVLGVGILLIGYFMDYEAYRNLPEFRLAVQEYFRQFPPPTALSDEQIDQFVSSLFRTLPFMVSSFWLIIHLINLQFAAIICRSSKIMPRPKDDIPATIVMPKAGIIALVASLFGLLVLPGFLNWIAIVFSGTLLTAFAMVGLAANHLRARTNPVSLIFLVLAYIFIAIFYIPLFLFAIGGLIRSFSNNKTSSPPAGPNLS